MIKRLKPLPSAKVAIVHYWLVGDAGGEQVVKRMLRMFPDADIFTIVYDKEIVDKIAPHRNVKASFLQRLPGVTRYYRKLLPIMPLAIEALDVSGYDLILSSESGPAKGIIPDVGALHICYCHSPMRYIWDHRHSYAQSAGLVSRISMLVFGPLLRIWDYQNAQRVDVFVANSQHVRRRIAAYYRRDATVINPPVEIFEESRAQKPENYYLLTGRHVSYKRIDLAIAVANATGRYLVITGTGPDTAKLRRLAGPTVNFKGQVTKEELQQLYAGCIGFLMPGEEDFGITPIEAMAAGRPVIAYGSGGVLDSVVHGVTGWLFNEQSEESLAEALTASERHSFDGNFIRKHAEKFSTSRFDEELYELIEAYWIKHQAS